MAATQRHAQAMDRAAAAFGAGRLDEAAALCAAILDEDAEHFYALHLSSVIALRRGHWADAVAHASHALVLRPGHADVLANRGAGLRRLGRFAEALADYDSVLRADPDAVDARHNRGVALAAMGRHDEALAEYARVLQRQPAHAEAFHNAGVSLAQLNRHDEAVAAYSNALAIAPAHARARFNRGLSHLALGRLAPGFADYEARHALDDRRAAIRSVPGPRWTGREALAGRTLLLLAEQGLGDCIQFQRFARILNERGARVVLEAPAPLAPLLSGLPYLERVIARDAALPPYDFHCPLASLPAVLGISLERLPAQEPPLVAPAEAAARWRERLAAVARPRIGLAWSGGTGAADDPRTIPLALLEPIVRVPASFVALQKEIRVADERGLAAFGVRRYDDAIADFRDTAALVEALDLVVTIDTSVAHLAGAMGRATWVMLPFAADWRWLVGRDTSPWYPAMRLFRQPRPGDWGSVVDAVARALAARREEA